MSSPLQSKGQERKRSYSKPNLQLFGSVRELTQGGTGQSSESASDPKDCANLTHQKTNPSCGTN